MLQASALAAYKPGIGSNSLSRRLREVFIDADAAGLCRIRPDGWSHRKAL